MARGKNVVRSKNPFSGGNNSCDGVQTNSGECIELAGGRGYCQDGDPDCGACCTSSAPFCWMYMGYGVDGSPPYIDHPQCKDFCVQTDNLDFNGVFNDACNYGPKSVFGVSGEACRHIAEMDPDLYPWIMIQNGCASWHGGSIPLEQAGCCVEGSTQNGMSPGNSCENMGNHPIDCTTGGGGGVSVEQICNATCQGNSCGGGCEQGNMIWCDCCDDGVPYPGTNSGQSCNAADARTSKLTQNKSKRKRGGRSRPAPKRMVRGGRPAPKRMVRGGRTRPAPRGRGRTMRAGGSGRSGVSNRNQAMAGFGPTVGKLSFNSGKPIHNTPCGVGFERDAFGRCIGDGDGG